MNEPTDSPEPREEGAPDEEVGAGAAPRAWIAALLALAMPGAGHLYLQRAPRAVVLGGIIVACALIGCSLDGRLDTFEDNNPLSVIATLAAMGSGSVYWILRLVVEYQGNIVAAGYEYGTTFLRTAGVLNLLLVLDAFDIGAGRKG